MTGNKQETGSCSRELLIIAAAAFLVRLIPILRGAPADLYPQQAIPVMKHLNIYAATQNIFPYSPVSMFLPAACGFLSVFTKISFFIIMKLPAAAGDVGIALAIYLILRKRGEKKAFLPGLLYALNPLSVLITGFHGNVISVATLLSFLAYAVLLSGVEKNYRLSALLLGLAIGFRSYPVLLLPLFLIKLNLPLKKRIAYFLYATVPTALSFIPFLILDYRSVLREAFAYSGSMDFGLAAILRAIYSLRYRMMFCSLPGNFQLTLHSITKFVFLAVYLGILLTAARRRLIVSIMAIFLLFFFVYTGVSAQYFIWILPFAFLLRDPLTLVYVFAGAWALANFYWIYHPLILFGRIPPPTLSPGLLFLGETVSLILLWLLCLVWALALVGGRGKKPGYDFF